MFKIDIDRKKDESSIKISGTGPEILSELTYIVQTIYRGGNGFTKEMFDEVIRLALQDDEESNKEVTVKEETLKKEVNKMKKLLSNGKDDKIDKLLDELTDEIINKLNI